MPGTSASTNTALLNRALELRRAGRLVDAGAIYEQLLMIHENLEVAYRRMWVQFADGNAPQAFAVREE